VKNRPGTKKVGERNKSTGRDKPSGRLPPEKNRQGSIVCLGGQKGIIEYIQEKESRRKGVERSDARREPCVLFGKTCNNTEKYGRENQRRKRFKT